MNRGIQQVPLKVKTDISGIKFHLRRILLLLFILIVGSRIQDFVSLPILQPTVVNRSRTPESRTLTTISVALAWRQGMTPPNSKKVYVFTRFSIRSL